MAKSIMSKGPSAGISKMLLGLTGQCYVRENCCFWLSIYGSLQRMKSIIAERVLHKSMNRVTLRFPYDAELNKITRRLPDPVWSSQMRCWHIPDSRVESFFPEPDDQFCKEVLQSFIQRCHWSWQINKTKTTTSPSKCPEQGGGKEDSQFFDCTVQSALRKC